MTPIHMAGARPAERAALIAAARERHRRVCAAARALRHANAMARAARVTSGEGSPRYMSAACAVTMWRQQLAAARKGARYGGL